MHGPRYRQRRPGLPRRSQSLCRQEPAVGHARENAPRPEAHQGRPYRLAQDPARQRLGRAGLAGRIRRAGLDADATPYLRGGNRPQPLPAPDALRPQDGRPGDPGVRQRRTEGAAPAEDRECGDPVVPGLLRTGRGLRSGVADDKSGARRRQLHRQRPEDLDDGRPLGGLDLLPGPDRRHRQESRRASPSC